MLNTSNYKSEEGIINSGEELSPADLETLKDPNCKTYYSRVKGSITHMPDGVQITFRGGMFATANKEVQAFLDKIADKPGTQVYTKQENKLDKERRSAALAAMVQPGDQRDDNGNIDPTREINLNTVTTTDSESAEILRPTVTQVQQDPEVVKQTDPAAVKLVDAKAPTSPAEGKAVSEKLHHKKD